MDKCVIYVRVSTDEQAKTGLSLDNQEEACREFAKRNNFEVLRLFREEGESAKTADRTELIKLIAFCTQNKNKIKALVVWKLDRFARNANDHMALKAMFLKVGVQLYSVTEHIEDTNSGRLMETILAAFNQFENEVRAERSTNGLRARIDQGGWVSYAPLGYANVKDALGRPTIAIDEDVAPIVRKVFQSFATGSYTQAGITAYAHELGLRARKSGKELALQSIVNMLRNRVYISRRQDKVSGVLAPMLHQPLVSEDVFYEVQSVLSGRHKEFRVVRDDEWPLRSGFTSCALCQTPITGSSPKGRTKHYAKYSCPTCRTAVTGKPVSVDRQM